MPIDVAALFEEHHEALLRYLIRLTGDGDVAQDAAQEAFARLVASQPRDDNPRAWLFAVATNLVRAWANTRARSVALLERAPVSVHAGDPAPGPDALAEAAARRDVVRVALDALPARDRTILLMREEGFSHREIADAVGTTTGSVGTMIARALDKLAALLPLEAGAL